MWVSYACVFLLLALACSSALGGMMRWTLARFCAVDSQQGVLMLCCVRTACVKPTISQSRQTSWTDGLGVTYSVWSASIAAGSNTISSVILSIDPAANSAPIDNIWELVPKPGMCPRHAIWPACLTFFFFLCVAHNSRPFFAGAHREPFAVRAAAVAPAERRHCGGPEPQLRIHHQVGPGGAVPGLQLELPRRGQPVGFSLVAALAAFGFALVAAFAVGLGFSFSAASEHGRWYAI